MKASVLIKKLQKLVGKKGGDPEVGLQSNGCCSHAHEIDSVDDGAKSWGNATDDHLHQGEHDMIVLRG